MITFEQVTKRYGERLALDSVSWHMDEGDCVVVTGHSGAGKTSLLRLITHEIQPTSGTLAIGTFRGGRLSRAQRALLRRTLGIIYEDFRLLNDRTPTAATLAAWNKTYAIPEGTGIVVNATSIGLFPDIEGRLDIDLDSLRPGMVVADVIPNPPRTLLVRDAAARGCRVIDGLGMLINQGVIGVKYWTGIDADPACMRRKLEEIFGV